jgi:hypothetical protein
MNVNEMRDYSILHVDTIPTKGICFYCSTYHNHSRVFRNKQSLALVCNEQSLALVWSEQSLALVWSEQSLALVWSEQSLALVWSEQ